MKKFERFRDRLTLKQVKYISGITSCSISGVYASICLISHFKENGFDFLVLSMALVMFMIISFLLYSFISRILDVDNKESIAREENAKVYVLSNYKLSKDSYTELKYCFDEALNGASDEETLMMILTDASYSFFAKLTENDEVNLIVKNATGSIVSDEIIYNFGYIKAYFEPLN